ncbi:MAG: hypothetical protein ACO3A4_05745 [Silvanigrellaceae bacterium]
MYSALLATPSSLAAYERDGQLKSWCWPRKDAFHNQLRFFIMGLVQKDECIWLDPERDQITFTWVTPLEHLQIHWHMHHPAVRGLHVRLDARMVDERTLEHTYTIDASEHSSLHDTSFWFLMAPEIAGRRSQFQCVRASSQANQIRCDADPYWLTMEPGKSDFFKLTGALQIDSQSSLGHLVQAFVSHPGAFRSIEMGRCAAVAVSPVVRWNSPYTIRMTLHPDVGNNIHPLELPEPVDSATAQISQPKNHTHSLSLKVLDALTSPNGALLASAECDWEMRFSGGYGFVWPRDAAFVGLSMMECGHEERAVRLALFLSKALGLANDFEQRYTDAALPAPSWCMRQPDQRPLVCLLWISLLRSAHLAATVRDELRIKLNTCLSAMADELLNSPAKALQGFDLWEEREGQHFFALVCAYGALSRGAEFALTDVAGERFDAAAQIACEMAQAHFSPEHAWPARTRASNGVFDFTADASLLACLMPVPEFPVEPEIRRRMFEGLQAALQHGVGYRRYVDDTYRGGGCWPLVGLWFGLSAREVMSEPESKEFIRFAIVQAAAASTTLGYLPEQIDPSTSHPTWVVPLAWSHAFFMQLSRRALEF